MNASKHPRALGLVLAIAVAGLAACAPSSPSGPTPVDQTSTAGTGEPDETSVRVAFLNSAVVAPYYAAEAEGFFAENGITVEAQVLATAPLIQAALDRGEVDIIHAVPSAALLARAGGQRDLVAILQGETVRDSAPDTYPLLVPSDSDIESIEDLVGKRVAVANASSQIVQSTRVVLERAGLDPDDVVWVEAPFATHRDLLSSHQVDATLTLEPFRTQLTIDGFAEDIAYPYQVAGGAGQPLAAWFTTRAWADAHPEEIAAFVTSLRSAMDFLVADPDAARETVASFNDTAPELLDAMVLPNWDHDADPATWTGLIDLLVETGSLEEPDDAAQVLYSSATS